MHAEGKLFPRQVKGRAGQGGAGRTGQGRATWEMLKPPWDMITKWSVRDCVAAEFTPTHMLTCMQTCFYKETSYCSTTQAKLQAGHWYKEQPALCGTHASGVGTSTCGSGEAAVSSLITHSLSRAAQCLLLRACLVTLDLRPQARTGETYLCSDAKP